MNTENNRSYYLQTMGITEWRLRQTITEIEVPLSVKGFYYQLVSNSSHTHDILFADVNLKSQSEEQILLQNICKALNVEMQGDCYELNDQQKELKKVKRIILMGPQVTQWVEKHYFKNKLQQGIHSVLHHSVFVTYSPAELLAKPNLKAEVWKSLKVLFGL